MLMRQTERRGVNIYWMIAHSLAPLNVCFLFVFVSNPSAHWLRSLGRDHGWEIYWSAIWQIAIGNFGEYQYFFKFQCNNRYLEKLSDSVVSPLSLTLFSFMFTRWRWIFENYLSIRFVFSTAHKNAALSAIQQGPIKLVLHKHQPGGKHFPFWHFFILHKKTRRAWESYTNSVTAANIDGMQSKVPLSTFYLRNFVKYFAKKCIVI